MTRTPVQADLQDCEQLLAKEPEGEAPALCFFKLASAPGSLKDPAARRLESLQASAPSNPWYAHYLANLRWMAGDSNQAMELYRLAAAQASRRGQIRAELVAREGLFRILSDAGQIAGAKREVERIVDLAKLSGDPALQARAGINQALYLKAIGDLQEAYAVLQRITPLVEKDGSYLLTRKYLFVFNGIARQTGRLAEARAGYRRLADLAAAQGETASEAAARTGLAILRKEELNEVPSPAGREEVLELARKALVVAQATKRPAVEADPLRLLGLLERDATAAEHLERCFRVAPSLQMQSYCRSALARRLVSTDPQAAEQAIHESLVLAEESGDILARTASWHERMRVSWGIYPPDQALKGSLAALRVIEALRDQQSGSASQPGLFSTWADAYYWLSGKLLDGHKDEEAFGVIERMRSRTLIDALQLSRPGPGVPPALLARRADVFLDIAQVQRKLLEASTGTQERDQAQAELRRLENEESGLRAQIARADPDFAALRAPNFASLERVQAALGSDEALLSFQVAPWKDLAGDFGGGSWLFVSTRSGTRVYRLPDRVELRPEVDVLTGMLVDREMPSAESAEASAHIYRRSLGAALAELPAGIQRLVIIPDDALHRLPFAALRSAESAAPLAARYQMTISPSATLWLRWREAQAPPTGAATALVFADPDSPATVAEAAAERGAAFATTPQFGELREARREGKSVVDWMGGDSELLVAKAASEAYLKQDGAARFGLLHFATHSLTDDVNPDRSYVLLSPGGSKEDGLLQVREIVDLDLDGRIVVLSSCGSASGKMLRGEGVMGLARAFFQAGAHTVVASLWPWRDDDGAALFDRFYLHLAEGKSVAAALQAAQRDRIAEGAPPEAWAGVIVLGNGDLVPVPGGRSLGAKPGIALALLLALLGGGTLIVLAIRASRSHRRL